MSYKPPRNVSRVACQGLRLRRKYKRGGTRIGLIRANQLCKGKTISMRTIKRMDSFFSRHSSFKKHHGKSIPSNSEISWKLWGGDAGRRWAKKIIKEKKNR